MACEEANVEVLSVLVHQPSSPSFINTTVSRWNPTIHCKAKGTITDSLAPSGVPDVQRQHSAARGLLPAGSPGSSGGREAPAKTGGRPDQQELGERGPISAGASRSHGGEGEMKDTKRSE